VDGTPATPVIQVASATGVQVAAEATAEALARIAIDQPAEVTPKGSAGGGLKAHVIRVARAVDSSTGSGEVRLAFGEAAPALPLGEGVQVRIGVSHKDGALIVPVKALRHGEDGKTEVVVVDHGKAAIRGVATGLAEEDRIEVISGLAAGETIVVDDPVGLAEGTSLVERP
jgi:RND family efflux transporter MFP subunit